MMKSEFFENVGCREIPENQAIFENLEKMYMADDNISKETIYEYGKKLCNFGLTEEEIEHNEHMKSEIRCYKGMIDDLKIQILKDQIDLVNCKDKEEKNRIKADINSNKDDINSYKVAIRLYTEQIIKI